MVVCIVTFFYIAFSLLLHDAALFWACESTQLNLNKCVLRNPPGVHKEMYQNWKHVLDLVHRDSYYWSEWNMEQQKKRRKKNNQQPTIRLHTLTGITTFPPNERLWLCQIKFNMWIRLRTVTEGLHDCLTQCCCATGVSSLHCIQLFFILFTLM